MKELEKQEVANNLAIQNRDDFTITEGGEAFISQRKLAKILNINSSTLMNHISAEHSKTNTTKGLGEKMLVLTSAYFAYESKVCTNEAKLFCKVLMTAGAKAYIYHEAGYEFEAKVKNEALQLALDEKTIRLEKLEERYAILDDKYDSERVAHGKTSDRARISAIRLDEFTGEDRQGLWYYGIPPTDSEVCNEAYLQTNMEMNRAQLMEWLERKNLVYRRSPKGGYSLTRSGNNALFRTGSNLFIFNLARLNEMI